MTVRTRFAPSPTGYLHLGGARTALYNWLYARKNNGKFILRIEDTDVERSTEASANAILEAMQWLGLDWDEGPFYQSQRLDLYRQKLDLLYKSGAIYPAFETKEELEAARAKAMAEKKNPIYDRASLKLSAEEVESRLKSGMPFVWRFKVPDEGYTEVPELLMGGKDTRTRNSTIGDFAISRPGTIDDPGMPLYNFVCTVDDAEMDISLVIRGNEHLTNATKQVLLYQAMGYKVPEFVHLPIILKNGKKMSKRDVDADGKFPVAVMERAKLGYLPQATLNHVALLGWSHPDGKEIMELEEMARVFTLDRLNKANPNFDEKKYFHFNSHYIAQMSDDDLLAMIKPCMETAGLDVSRFGDETLKKMIGLEKTRCQILSEFPHALSYFFAAPTDYEEKGKTKHFFAEDIDGVKIIDAAIEALSALQTFDHETIEHALAATVEKLAVPYKVFGPAIRLALTGRMQSPGLAEMMEIMGRDESLARLNYARDFITKRS